MYRYLLPGSEFHDILNQQQLLDNIVYVVFEYTENISQCILDDKVRIAVCQDGSNDIEACLSKDGTTLYVHSEYDIMLLDCQMMFYRMSLLSRVVLNNFNTSQCDNMRRMFMGCSSLIDVDMSNMFSSNVEDFTEMFSGCISLQSIDISEFTVPSVKESCVFSDMFKKCISLRRLSVGERFFFNQSMSLLDPDPFIIKESDGTWHLPVQNNVLHYNELEGGIRGTYYACNVEDTAEHYGDLVTLSSLEEASKQIALEISKKFKYLNA